MPGTYEHLGGIGTDRRPSEFTRNAILLVGLAIFTPFIVSILQSLPFFLFIPGIAFLGGGLCIAGFKLYKSWQQQNRGIGGAPGDNPDLPGPGAHNLGESVFENNEFTTFLAGSARTLISYTKSLIDSVLSTVHDTLQPVAEQDQYAHTPEQVGTPRRERRQHSAPTSPAGHAGARDAFAPHRSSALDEILESPSP